MTELGSWPPSFPPYEEGDPVHVTAKRLNAVLLPDVSAEATRSDLYPKLRASPELARGILDQLGIEGDSLDYIIRIAGQHALSELLVDAFELIFTQQPRDGSGTTSAAIGLLKDDGKLEQIVGQLLEKHAQAPDKWNRITADLYELTGHRKSKKWLQRHAKQLKPEDTIPATAFAIATGVLRDAELVPTNDRDWSRLSELTRGAMEAARDDAEEQALWTTRAIAIIQRETANAPSLLQVFSYVSDNPSSITAVKLMKGMVCLYEGLGVASDLLQRSDSSMETSVQLFAQSFIFDDKAFAMCHQQDGFEFVEAMGRCAQSVLQNNPVHLPALLVTSRLADDEDKIQWKTSCIEALSHPSNTAWVSWSARLYEMRGLAFGGVGRWQEAFDDYRMSVSKGGGRLSEYCTAMCLNMLKKRSAALTHLDRYLGALRGTCNSLLDEYQLPDAIYLKGILHAHEFDMVTAKECCDYAQAVEAKRCPFFGIVNCSAKRSLMRICKFASGNAQSQAKAYADFMAAYSIHQQGGAASSSQTVVSLAELGTDNNWGAKLAEPDSEGTSANSHLFTVHILEFSRHPHALRDALLNGENLKPCRDSLFEQGRSPELPCGTKVFTPPEYFDAVVDAVKFMDLKVYHVVASEEYRDLVISTVETLPSRAQVREKLHSTIKVSQQSCALCGAPNAKLRCSRCRMVCYCCTICQKQDWKQHRKMCMLDAPGPPFVVKSTFLSIPVPSSLRSGPDSSLKTASTTDACQRKGTNPRRM